MTPAELRALVAVERAARAYARHTHGNLGRGKAYRDREAARDHLLDELDRLDRTRGKSAIRAENVATLSVRA